MKNIFAVLCTAAAIALAPTMVSSPSPGKPCETPDGRVTQACMDCINHGGGPNGDPTPAIQKCGYPGTVANPPQNPQGQTHNQRNG